MAIGVYNYRRGTEESFAKVKKDIEALLTSRERITDEHKTFINHSDGHYTYCYGLTISELKKWCIDDPNNEGKLNLLLNEAEYFQWWDQWYNEDKSYTGIYTKYHFYYDDIGNGNNFESDPFYDPILSKGGGEDGPHSTIVFGGFTKKEIMDDYFIRDGKGYGLLDTLKKFYGVDGYEEKYEDIMNFAKNQMIYLEEDIPTSFDSIDPAPIPVSPNLSQILNEFKPIISVLKEIFDDFKDKNNSTPIITPSLAQPKLLDPDSKAAIIHEYSGNSYSIPTSKEIISIPKEVISKEIRQKKLEALATDTLDAVQKLADKIKER